METHTTYEAFQPKVRSDLDQASGSNHLFTRNDTHGSAGKESAYNAGDTGEMSSTGRHEFDPWVKKIP